MRVLVVYAHPYTGSFCHAVLDEVTRGLHDGGHLLLSRALLGNRRRRSFPIGQCNQDAPLP